MEKIKIVFIGGLTNGKIVFDYLNSNKYVDLAMAVTYPNSSEKPRHVDFPDESFIKKDGQANKHIEQIIDLKPDLIIVAGWSELLDDRILSAPKMGVIGFHPSKLPNDRGRSVIAWQLEEGYTETALTMFYYNDIPDGGDIIGQDLIQIEENDYVNDILDKVDGAANNLMKAYFPLIRMGKAPRKQQSVNEGNFRRLRTENDSKIDWNTNNHVVYNKIRAVSPPYPCAVGIIDNVSYRILESEKLADFPYSERCLPGEIVASLHDKSMIVKCREGLIRIKTYEKL